MCGILGVGSWTEMGRQYKSCFYFISFLLRLLHWHRCMSLIMDCLQHNTRLLRGPDVCVCCSLVEDVGFADPLGVSPEHGQEHDQVITPQNQEKSIMLTYFS